MQNDRMWKKQAVQHHADTLIKLQDGTTFAGVVQTACSVVYLETLEELRLQAELWQTLQCRHHRPHALSGPAAVARHACQM